MDKHNRPYKCQHKECSSLPGFTYKGGLTRHETEVHGNARQFLCRHKHCNRATHGFAREDNLRDHEERMHKEDRKQKQRRRIDAGFGNPVGTDRIDKAARHPHPQSHSHSQPHLPPGSADYRHLLRMVERSASSAAQTKQMQLRLVQLESALQELRHANSVAT